MRNKIELKRTCIISGIIIGSFLLIFTILYQIQYQTYTKQFNEKLNRIIVKLQEEYSDLTPNAIMQILNETEETDVDLLRQYGIDLKQDAILLKNDSAFQKFLVLDLTLLVIFGICLFIIFIVYNDKKNKKII